MSDEILVNVSPSETRVALVENGLLQEVYVERVRNRGLVNNIYLGKVVRVLPGMQAAFVDLGMERAGFIHANDFCSRNPLAQEEETVAADSDFDSTSIKEVCAKEVKDIRELVRQGQTLLVQVVKEPLGTKGPRLTTQLSISSRNLVYMPYGNHIGISTRIEDEAERERLRTLVAEMVAKLESPPAGGFIVRTVAEGSCALELESDIPFLLKLWRTIEDTSSKKQAPTLVYEDLPLSLRTVRDLVKPHIEKVRVDHADAFTALEHFAKKYAPETLDRLELYRGERPLFDLNGVEDELQKALGKQVALKSGGYLIVEQTEAMTTIDVNTGGFVGHRNLEETIFKTNMEAATAIARQLRLRNLGGIIVLDFIDMSDAEHQRQVLRTLEKALTHDRALTSITGVSDLGLVEMSRKRTRESLNHTLCQACPVCDGRGALKTAQTVCYEIFREILRDARVYDNDKFLVLASQAVVDCLLDEESTAVADLEALTERTIEFRVETLYNQEQYDIVLV
jgi:ribonuclease G